MKKSVLTLVLWFVSFLLLPAQSFVVMQTGADGKTSISGDRSLLKESYPPASTFKLLIAWEALKEGVATPETKHRSADQGGREVNMAEAMYASSNDYFRWLASRLDPSKFNALIEEAGWGGAPSRSGLWLKAGPDAIERGGELKVTVAEMHSLILQLREGKAGSVSEELKKVMKRPPNDSSSRVYGKSGAWGGAVWMTGYYDSEDPSRRKAVTVFVPYIAPDWKPAREKAQIKFYRSLGIARPVEK